MTDIHSRVIAAASAISHAIHGRDAYVTSDDGACVIYDATSRVGYVIHHRTGIERVYEGHYSQEHVARRDSDAALRAASLAPSLATWSSAYLWEAV